MVGHPGNAPGSLLVPSQAGCLSPSCPLKKVAEGGGHSPQTSLEVLPVFKTGYRNAVLHLPFKSGFPGENCTRDLFLRREALPASPKLEASHSDSVELRQH